MTAALIVAAGRTATKQGFQPLAQVGSISAVQRLILVFEQAGVDRVVLVGDSDNGELERHVSHMNAVCLRNGQDNAEMLDSVKTGLAYLQGKCSRVLVTPVDVPLFSEQTVQQLMASKARVAVPSHDKKAGHPLLLSARLFGSVMAYSGAGGLAGAIRESGIPIEYIEVPDEGVVWDVQRQDDYAHLLERHSLMSLRPVVKVYLAREQTFFGPGPYLLLRLIGETESLRMACEQMGISYSKGWRMVEKMEQQMGKKLVNRSRGGSEKGHSTLTEQGHELLQKYARFEKGCAEQAKKLFDKIFAEDG